MENFDVVRPGKMKQTQHPYDRYIYLHEWLISYGKLVGKYSSTMDAMAVEDTEVFQCFYKILQVRVFVHDVFVRLNLKTSCS